MSIKSILPELYAVDHIAEKLTAKAAELVFWDLTQRQICDLELIMNRGFYPLDGFLTQKDYEEVVENMRLASGKIWPIPITLDVSQEFADMVKIKQEIALRDQEGVILAILSISDKWIPNKKREADILNTEKERYLIWKKFKKKYNIKQCNHTVLQNIC